MIELISAIEKVTIDKEGQTKLTLTIPLICLESVNKLIKENKGGGKNFALAMRAMEAQEIANHTQLVDEEEFMEIPT